MPPARPRFRVCPSAVTMSTAGSTPHLDTSGPQPRVMIMAIWLPHRQYPRDHQELPGQRAGTIVTPASDALAGACASGGPYVVMAPITTYGPPVREFRFFPGRAVT